MLPMLVVVFCYMVLCMVSKQTLFIFYAVLKFVCLAVFVLLAVLQLCSTDRK
jgi:hypothetical protein